MTSQSHQGYQDQVRSSRRAYGAPVEGALAKERGIWQRRFWEHAIRDEGDYARHMDCLHYNPVKRHMAERPQGFALRLLPPIADATTDEVISGASVQAATDHGVKLQIVVDQI